MYDVIIKDPVTGDKVLVKVPFEVVSVHRSDGIRFLSVNLQGGSFNLDGSTFIMEPIQEV